MATMRPIDGQCHPSSSALPTSTSVAGNKASNRVSFMRSTAHMPRVTRRTMEPAKLFACQSVEKRCTRRKASPASRAIKRTVSRLMFMSERCRPATRMAPSNNMVIRADRAPFHACRWVPACMAIASTMRPAKTGMNKSAMVATIIEEAITVTSQASRRQWPRRKARTSRMTFGVFLRTRMVHSSNKSGNTSMANCRGRKDNSGKGVACVPDSDRKGKGPEAAPQGLRESANEDS